MTTPSTPMAWARLKALDLGIATLDMGTAVFWLRRQEFCNGKVAAVGFCGGGRFAYLAAARCRVDGAASLYGLGISEHLGELGAVNCPLQLHYGLKDQHIPQQEIDAVSAGVRGRPSARCSSIRRPGTRSPIRCGRPTMPRRPSSPANGSRRC